jgi:DNA-binding response OmpR family regulator
MTILICEDNRLAMRTLSVILEKEGYSTETAIDGNEAIDLLRNKDYDLLLVDIHLPFHSGLELIKYLRSELKKKTPVLVITAFSDPQMQKQAAELKINGYFTKPFNPPEIIAQIKSILNK